MKVNSWCRFLVGFIAVNALLLAGCDSDSTIDSVMNSGDGLAGTKNDSAGPSTGLPAEPSRGQSSEQPSGAATRGPTGGAGAGGTKQSMAGVDSTAGDLSDVATRVDQPRVTRENFAMRVAIAAREPLLEQTSRVEKSFVLVGKVTPTVDDWHHIEFVDFYDQDRQFQFRTNGIKILVPRELVNRLHNATIDWDASSKRFFVTLAK